MGNKMSSKYLQIILNITFLLMISCSDNQANKPKSKLFGSTHFLRPSNATRNVTVHSGNFTIRNSKIVIKNGQIPQNILKQIREEQKEVANIFDPFIEELTKRLFGNFTLPPFPKLNGK